MEQYVDILNELKELSPVVAAIPKLNVFSVPDGYFAYLATDVLMGIQHEFGAIEQTSPAAEVPAGYFDSLADTILSKIKAMDVEDAATEIQGLSPVLATIRNENVFETPQGYFESLAGNILDNIKSGEATIDAAAEIRALSPMLYSIQSENVFEVPRGYFDQVSDEVMDQLKPKAKVVKMRRANFFKYAVAAAFTGMMALGVFKFTNVTDSGKNQILPDYVTEGLQVKDVDKELSKISDEEIVKFLEANGTDVKTAIVANSTDKNELPAREEYLMDEQALDKYLNSINIEDLKN